jgi:glutamate synthase (NADPH/NADH) small chain
MCILAKKGDPVAIGNLERFAADYERPTAPASCPRSQPPTGKRVAVVGSGPSSLTVAGDLIVKGHAVTVLEAFHKPGGVLVYGIPEFRCPRRSSPRKSIFWNARAPRSSAMPWWVAR